MKNDLFGMMKAAAAAVCRVTGVNRNDGDLANERAAYAEIGRTVCVPFSSGDVYERFAGQVAKIIPFDMIIITRIDPERESFRIMYTFGTDVAGIGPGYTFPFRASIVSKVAASKQAMRTDKHLDASPAAQTMVEAGLLSRCATPLIANERVVGTLHLASGAPEIYGGAELARLEIVGNQIAGAIASEILLQAERDRASQLRSLYDVAAIIAQPLSLETKAQRIVDSLMMVSGADHVILRRADEDREGLVLVASATTGPMEFQQSLRIADANSATLKAYRNGQSILVNDYPRYIDARPNLLDQGVESMYFVPVRSNDRTLGLLSVASKTPTFFDDGQTALIAAFANEIGSLFRSDVQSAKLQASEVELETMSRELALSNQALESHYMVSQVFTEPGDFCQKAEAALEKLIILTGADWATFRLTKPNEPGLHLAAAAGAAVAEFPPLPVLTNAHTVSTKAFTAGRTIVMDDYTHLAAASAFLIDMGMESMVFLPVRINDRALGLVTVISTKKNTFGPELVDLLTFVVERLGVLVENSILNDESERSRKDLQVLAEALAESNRQINQSNQLLEERVLVRTQELEAARERAMRSEKLAIIGQLSGGIAHDLRNPLGAIKNAAYLAKRKFNAERSAENHEKVAELLQFIDGEVVRAEDVITDLLSSGSNREIAFTMIEVEDFISDSMSHFVLRENIDLTINVESDLPPILGDGSQLVRALQNLVSNAQDAMPGDGRLSIDAKRYDGSVEILITDTGSGISPENIDKIFEPLFTAKSHGTGLGLAICQEIINKHNGTISVESEIGVGTSFNVNIPFAVRDGSSVKRPSLV